MPRRGSPYGPEYTRQREALLADRPRCVAQVPGICLGVANSADHYPPLYRHHHRNGSGCCRLQPMCLPCNNATSGGWRATSAVRKARRAGIDLRDGQGPSPSRQW
jgi:hypothetical protein